MKISKIRSFKFKTTIYFTSLVVFILLLLGSSVIVLCTYYFEQHQLKIVDDITAKLPKQEVSEEYLEYVAVSNNVCIIKGNAINDFVMYNCTLYTIDDNITNSLVDFSYSNLDYYEYRFYNKDNNVNSVILASHKGDFNYFIYANLDDTSIFSNLIREQFVVLTCIAIIISILISYYLASRLSRPLVDITESARLLGTNKDLNFKDSDIKEVKELVDVLKKSNEEISKTSEYKKDLLANVSHDLKTPLTMIKAYAEMIRDISYNDKEKQNEHLNIIISETDRLTLLVNDILDISKLQNNSSFLNKEKYDLIPEIYSIINSYQIIKEVEDYKIQFNSPKKLFINADKSKLNQVIYNLINNAINYTGEDKNIIVNVKKGNLNSILVEIIDSGKGIDKKDLPHIWEKYYKTDKKHKRNIVSSGIGLSIVKEILVLHNYEFGVETSSKGTKFYFTIK